MPTPRNLRAVWNLEAVTDLESLWGGDLEADLVEKIAKEMRDDIDRALGAQVIEVNTEAIRDWLRVAIPICKADVLLDLNGVRIQPIQDDADMIDIGDVLEVIGGSLPTVVDVLASLDL